MSGLAFAVKAKGPVALVKRAYDIASRYSIGTEKMACALDLFSQMLDRFGCGASFPLTGVALQRNRGTVAKYLNRNIEFIVHGYVHIDHTRLAPEEQLAHLQRARAVFDASGIAALGFRAPYLRYGDQLYDAMEAAGLSYSSNHTIIWDVLDISELTPTACDGYQRALELYVPSLANTRPSLPYFRGNLVEIPVSLPDDEILLDRLDGDNDLVATAWQRILTQAHQLGELFTIQLHPERTALGAHGLKTVLSQARALVPKVWIARLDEIADWWRARAAATVKLVDVDQDQLRLSVSGPDRTRVLLRSVQTDTPTTHWADGYRQAEATTLIACAAQRPIIGISPSTSPQLVSFLRQQGYIVETSEEGERYSYYLRQSHFSAQQERSLLKSIEETDRPLVRLGRWPDGARSALAVTGDIDALTLWDYGLRLLGR